MFIHAIAYSSWAATALSLDQVSQLARNAAANNLIMDVTGVLLTDGSRFLHYLEGPEEALKVVYRRIISARSHTDMVELGRSKTGLRRFPSRPLHWLPVEPEDLRIAIVSDWRGLSHRTEVDMFQVPTGIDRVMQLVDPLLGIEMPDFSSPM